MIKYFLFLVVVFSSHLALSQQITLSGKVLNKADNSGIHVLNRTTNYSTITNQNGAFVIDVSLQDTLYFSSLRYSLKEVIVDSDIYNSKVLNVELLDRVNELDEVVVGNQLSGDLLNDLKGIDVKKDLNFYDVGIPGFRGVREEKIAPVVPGLGTFTSVDVEAIYKHLSGYYKKLRIKRKWEAQNIAATQLIAYYTADFYVEAFNIPKNRLYDFMLYCMETTQIQSNFLNKNYAGVLNNLEESAVVYLKRLQNTED